MLQLGHPGNNTPNMKEMDKAKTYDDVIGELGQRLELARADAERLEEELMDEAIVRAAHPLYVELLRAQERINALSEAIELIINNESPNT